MEIVIGILFIICILDISLHILKSRNKTNNISHINNLPLNSSKQSIDTKHIGNPLLSNTTGENEFYKQYLKDPRWINKRNQIIKRDHYICQNCHNMYKLSTLEDLKQIVNFPEVANEVIQIFQHIKDRNWELRQIIDFPETTNEFIQTIGHINITQVILKRVSTKDLYPYYIQDLNIYLQSMRIAISLDHYNCYPLSLYNISTNPNVPKQTVTFYDINCSSIRFLKRDENISKTDHVYLQFIPDNSTNNEWYLIPLFNYIIKSDYKGQALLIYNEYGIIFPLYKLSCVNNLEVHHKAYPSRLPWEVNDNLLITLCHKCHKQIHQNQKHSYGNRFFTQ